MARLPYAEHPDPVPPLNIFRLLANADTAFRPFMGYGLSCCATSRSTPSCASRRSCASPR